MKAWAAFGYTMHMHVKCNKKGLLPKRLKTMRAVQLLQADEMDWDYPILAWAQNPTWLSKDERGDPTSATVFPALWIVDQRPYC